ncbi:MAG: HIT family protein [Beutenbergiaceae bacterium]
MATLFTRIIDGEIPGRFVWSDEICVAFLTIEPVQPGHLLVVPRTEVDQWIDLETQVASHCFEVAARLGRALRQEFAANRIGLMIQGYEIPHAHLHVWPSMSSADFDLGSGVSATDAELDEAAGRILARISDDG